MAEASVDLIVPHVGLTIGGTIGAGASMSLDEAVTATQHMIDAARAVKPDVIALAHGGTYARYYNDIRTHWSLDKDALVFRPIQRTGIIISRPIVGGLHHHYVRV